MSIEVESGDSKAQALIAQLGWSARPSGDGSNVAVAKCPYCGCGEYKFFMHIGGDRDGLHDCKRCGEKGNLWQLQEKLGMHRPSAVSVREMMPGAPAPLPDPDRLHYRLMNDDRMGPALDHLVAERKFSIDVIKRLKLGAEEFAGKLWVVYPYLSSSGQITYFKARTIPPDKKEFRSPTGREAELYNSSCLRPGIEELIICEGEADTIALINQGYNDVVGVPGAGVKKAAWLEMLDRLAPKVIYLCYDSDKPGRDAAREMGARIGLDKVRNIALPDFEIEGGHKGKDVGEFFGSGHLREEFEALKAEAKPFEVDGVTPLCAVIEELLAQVTERGNVPTFLSPWPSLNAKIGGFERGDVCGVLAEGKVGKTSLALNWVDWFAKTGQFNSMMFCGEMKPTRLVRKWVSSTLQLDDTPGRSQLTPEAIRQAAQIGAEYPKDLLFGYSQHNTPKEVFETIRQAVRRYGIDAACYDNLHLMSRSINNAAQEINVLSKQFKELAMELNIFLLLILQPRKVQEGKMVNSNDINGSSAPSKDVDCNICLHRNRVGVVNANALQGYMETEENFEPILYARADLTRYAPGGVSTLYMDGCRSTVREYTTAEMAAAVALPAPGRIVVEAGPI